ncbi:disease resistance protein RPS5-like [Prunus yedoensis var. nudiflora]|uniref:Disease resistance protein RPS5-like n=1 Tax=Prunus yedoensis var. nudiflora TaxID=2094558 RepID=A0A314ZR27_PRUYE|nr:disease resistance protein RPS5-like [Prunus yedoensis var. nudiflora]
MEDDNASHLITFPTLTVLNLTTLPKLLGFYTGNQRDSTYEPNDESVNASHLDKMKETRNDQQHDQVAGSSSKSKVPQVGASCNALFPSNCISWLPNLKELLVDCFTMESSGSEENSEPEELVVASLTSGQWSKENNEPVVSAVEHFWKNVQPGFQGFQNSKYLCRYEIYKLLVNLQEVVIMSYKNMETIVLTTSSTEDNIHEEGKETGGSGTMTLFPKLLNWFEINNMPNLERFCPDAYSFAWPSCTRTLWVTPRNLQTSSASDNLENLHETPSTQAFDKLRQLTLIGLPMMSHIWEKGLQVISSFGNLRLLQKIVVEHCGAMEKIVGEARGGGEMAGLGGSKIKWVSKIKSICSSVSICVSNRHAFMKCPRGEKRSYQVVESMRLGMEPNLAAKDAISRIARKFPDFLRVVFDINKKGVHAGACHGWTFQYSVRSPEMDDVKV